MGFGEVAVCSAAQPGKKNDDETFSLGDKICRSEDIIIFKFFTARHAYSRRISAINLDGKAA